MELARNIVVFGVDDSSSSHADNHINNFLLLGEGPTFGINGSFGSPVIKFRINFAQFSINFTKANSTFCFSLYYNAGNCYLFFNGKEVFKFKAGKKNVNFETQFCLGRISNSFSNTESREIPLNGNVYHFSVDYNSIDKSDILNINKYIIAKNDIK